MASVPSAATNKTWIVQGNHLERSAAMVARALVEPDTCSIPLRLLNPRNEEVVFPKGTVVAELEGVPLENMGIAVVSDSKEAQGPTEKHRQWLWELVEQSEQSLNEGEKEMLLALLLEYHGLFAEGSQDLGQTGGVQHKINTGTAPPIRQQVRRILQFRQQEAKKLLDDMLGGTSSNH